MSSTELSHTGELAVSPADRRQLLASYKQRRKVMIDLSNNLAIHCSFERMDEGASRLGILQGNTIVMDSEDHADILMDYCLHEVRIEGRSAIEQYLIDSPPEPDTDEMTCLQAMQHAIYSLFVVESVDRGLGVIVRDLRSQESYLLIDIGLSQSTQEGLVLASRLIQFEDFATSAGAALPLGIVPQDEMDSLIQDLLATVEVSKDVSGHFDPAPLINAWLQGEGSANVSYEDSPIGLAEPPRLSGGGTSRKVGRNEKCPCGSNRKFKNCCLRRG